jgi:CTP:molybdopterin cytidylyltransferase MocA
MFPAVARLEGDVGARSLLRDAQNRGIRLSASDESCFLDADTPDDLMQITRHLYRMSV